MGGYVGKHSNSPRAGIAAIAEAERKDQWGPTPGEIVSYDAATMRATVKMLVTKTDGDGNTLEPPLLEEVPVDVQVTSNGGMTFPIGAGTRVMLVPQKGTTEDGGGRSFNLSDMRATINGGNAPGDAPAGVDADNIHLRANAAGDKGVKVSPDGKFQVDMAEGELIDLLAQLCETLAGDKLSIAYGSSGGSGHALQQASTYAEIGAKLRGSKI